MSTLVDLRNRVANDKLDDDSFDGPTIDRFINDAQRDIFNTYELPFMEKTLDITLGASLTSFDYPVDLQILQSAVVTAPDGTQHDIMNGFMDFRSFNQSFPTPANNDARPVKYWTSFAGKMYTATPMDAEYTLTLFYIKKPTLLEDDADVPEVPEEFEEILVLGAFKRVLERNEDYDLAGVIGNQYNDQLDKMVARYGFRLSDGPIVMKQPNRRPASRQPFGRSW